MKTREQAEARAMELFPNTHIATVNQLHEVSRDAFLQCFDEMQQDKQTCGFCVEPKKSQHISEQSEEKVNKSVQKELLCEMMRKDEEDGVYDDIISHALRKGSKGVIMPKAVRFGTLNKENQIREAAEKVVVVYLTSELTVPYRIQRAIEQLEKALK